MLKKLSLVSMFLILTGASLLLMIAPVAAQLDLPVNTGSVRVVNALVGLGAVDVYLDNERVAFNLAPENATPYFIIAAGKHNVAVRPVDADPLSAPIADILVDVPPNQSKTAIAYQKQFATQNFIPSYEQTGSFFVMDDDRSPIGLGQTRMTGVHLGVGTPGFLSIGYPSGASLLHRLEIERPYGTIDVSSGTYSINLINADTPDLDLLERVGDQKFNSNTLYTFIIVPAVTPPEQVPGGVLSPVGPGSDRPRLFIVRAPVDPPQNDGLRLRVIHAAHSTAVIDIYVDGRLLVPDMFYSVSTDYLGLEDYSHTIAIRRAGANPDSPPLAQAMFNITLENRSQPTWTLLLLNASDANTDALEVIQPGVEAATTIINTPGGGMIMRLLPDNISQTRRDYARVRLINAADGVPSLRLFTNLLPAREVGIGTPTPAPTPTPAAPQPPVQLLDAVLFGAEALDAELPVGLYNELSIVPGGSSQKLLTLDNKRLVSGIVYTLVVMGSPAGDPALQVQVLEDYGTGISLDRLYIGTITTLSANIRTNPENSSRIQARLAEKTEVQVLGRTFSGDFIRIRYTNPVTNIVEDGWISGTANIIAITRLGVPVSILSLPEFTQSGQ